MKKTIITNLCVGLFLLTACTINDNPIVGPDDHGEGAKDYVERMVPVVDPQNNPQGMVTLRFYNDMPNVAYVSISHFQSMMYPGTTVEVTQTSPGMYALTSPCGTATVDIQKDIFESDDYESFTNMMGMIQPGMPNTAFDALPILRWKSIEASPKQVHVALDYGRYGIDLRADDRNVYFPFATVADLYTDGFIHTAAFNGQTVMVAPNGAYSIVDGYPEFFITPILNEHRTADMVDFAYRNLCFTLTNFFGYPGSTLLEASMKEKGLDQALTDYGEAGQMTRQLLLSPDMYEYISGTMTLGYLLNDHGHTYTDVTVISNINGNPTFKATLNDIRNTKKEQFLAYCPEYKEYIDASQTKNDIRSQATELRKLKFGEGVNYYKEGNTAYCIFNSFMCDDSGWRKFYRGEGPKPTLADYPNDWMIILLDALEKAENDPEVKNFVIDIAANGGGSTDIVMLITSLLCNKSDFYYDNVLTGQHIKSSFDVDRNLDGKFDEKDAEVKYHLNFGLLVSNYSFSCANLLPALLKDYGIPLFGQRSAGGACCVLFNPSAEGFGYRYSTHRARLTDTKGNNVDAGIEPTYPLETVDDFYDITKISQLMNSYYAN